MFIDDFKIVPVARFVLIITRNQCTKGHLQDRLRDHVRGFL